MSSNPRIYVDREGGDL